MNSKYLKLGLILLIPLVIGLIRRGFANIFTGGGRNNTVISQENESGEVYDPQSGEIDQQLTQLFLGSSSYNGQAATLTIAVPDWFDTSTMSGTEQSLKSDNIILKRLVITGADYHTQLWKLMASGSAIDLSLIASDRTNDCGQGCAITFDYSQPIDAFLLSPVLEAIRDPYRTMIPYGLDPLVTYHTPQRRVGGSRSSLFNDILINTNTNKTAGSLPLAIGIGPADKALLRAGKEPYPGYTELLHQMMIQFSTDESLLKQFIQLTDTAQLRSYTRMKQTIETISDKFPICNETVAACLVRFTVSNYGFGYLTDLMRLPPSRQSTVEYDQFPIETTYYPLRLRGFIINQRSTANTAVIGRFLSSYITDMLNTNPAGGLELISPFVGRFEAQGYDEQYINIMRFTDSFHIVRGGKFTSLDRARNGGLLAILDGNSTINRYLIQQGVQQGH